MNDNVTDNDDFINTYVRKQEEFNIEIIRRKLELSVRLQLLQSEISKTIAEKNHSEELLKQSISGLSVVTAERDALKAQIDTLENSNSSTINKMKTDNATLNDKHNQELKKLREDNEEKVRLIRDNVSSLTEKLKQTEHYESEINRLTSDNTTLKNNYDFMKTSYMNLQKDYESVIKVKKKKASN